MVFFTKANALTRREKSNKHKMNLNKKRFRHITRQTAIIGMSVDSFDNKIIS